MCGTVDRWTGKEKVDKAKAKQAALQIKIDDFNNQIKYNQDHIRFYMPKAFNARYQNALRELQKQLPALQSEAEAVNAYAASANKRDFWGDLAGSTVGIIDGYYNALGNVLGDVVSGEWDDETTKDLGKVIATIILVIMIILAPEGWQTWLAMAAALYGSDAMYNDGRLMGATFRAIDGVLDDILGIDQDQFLGIRWENNFIGDFTYNTFNSNGEYYELAIALANIALQLANGYYNGTAVSNALGTTTTNTIAVFNGATSMYDAFQTIDNANKQKKALDEKVKNAEADIKRKQDAARKRYLAFRDMESFDFMSGFIFTKQAGRDGFFDPSSPGTSLAMNPSINNDFMQLSEMDDFTYYKDFDSSLMGGGSNYLRSVFVGI